MQGATVQPGNNKGPAVELAVDVGRSEPGGATPDGQASRAQVLRLNRQQPLDDLDCPAGQRPQQELGGQPAVVTVSLHSSGG
jgi:hypothetical protein